MRDICGDAGDSIKGEEKKVGPSIVSKYEVIKAFTPYFDLISIERGVFDSTNSYANFPCLVSVWKKRDTKKSTICEINSV